MLQSDRNDGRAVTISVIITTFNEEANIRRALESATYDNLDCAEVIVIDDGSTDGTVDIVRGFNNPRVRLIEAGRLGRAGALQKAVAAARGHFVANLDADDEALPGRLAAQASFLEAHPTVAWVGGAEEMVDTRRGERFVRRYPESDAAIRRQSAKCIPYSHSAVMFRRSLLHEGLNYDPSQPYLIDFEFFLRVAKKHLVANLSEVVVRRHVRGESYFQSHFKTSKQNRRLAFFCAKAVYYFRLPPGYYIYPGARLIYPFLPNSLKRYIRRNQGLEEI